MSRPDHSSNGRASRAAARSRPGSSQDELPALRRRSPLAYWTAVVVLLGLVATLLGGVVASLAR